MLAHIIRKEIQSNITSPKFVFTFLLCTILILVSVYTGAASYQADLKEYNLALVLNRKHIESQTNWWSIQNMEGTVPKPPTVLSAVAVGIGDAVGRNATLDYTRDPKPIDSKYDSNPVFAIFGPLDLTLIVKIVLSLFAILFTFDAVAGEKEMGTLKLTLSNQVPRDQLILGKTIGGFISLIMPLAVPFLMGLILLNIFPDISLSGRDWVRLGFIFFCFLLYLSVFFNLGLLVSSRSDRSSSSLFILLFIWVVSIFIIPKVAVMVSKQFVPVPAIRVLDSEKRAFSQQVQKERQEANEAWFRANPWPQGKPAPEVAAWQEAFKAFLEEGAQDYLDQTSTRYAVLDSEYQKKRRRQQVLALNLSRFSPASSMTLGVLGLAKTGIAEHERFLDTVRTYQTVFGKWVNRKSIQAIQFDGGNKPEKPDLAGMPEYGFVPQSLGDSASQVLMDVFIMVLMNIMLFAGAYVSFLKYDVR